MGMLMHRTMRELEEQRIEKRPTPSESLCLESNDVVEEKKPTKKTKK